MSCELDLTGGAPGAGRAKAVEGRMMPAAGSGRALRTAPRG